MASAPLRRKSKGRKPAAQSRRSVSAGHSFADNASGPHPQTGFLAQESGWIVWTAALALALVTFGVWSPALHFGFVYDDHLQVVANPWIQSWSYLGQLLRQPLWAQLGAEHASPYYRPFFAFLLLTEYTILGANPALWHLASVALHVLVVLAIFGFLLLHFGRWLPAFCGACVFACSPVAAEVVNWISAFDDALFALLILLALCAVAAGVRSEDVRRRAVLRFVSAGLLVLAVLSKETGVVGIALVAGYEWLFAPAGRRGRMVRQWPLLIPAAVLLVSHPWPHGSGRSLAQAASVVPYAAALALKKLVWPLPVSEFYGLWFGQPHPAGSLALHVAALAIMAGVLVWAGMRSRWIAFAALTIVLPLGVAFVGIRYFRDYDLFHDRDLYLPLAGIAMLIAGGAARLAVRPRLMGAVLAGLALLAAGEAWLSRSVSKQFSSDVSLFSHAVEVAPRNVLALQLLAEAELRMGDCETAIAHYRQAEVLRPDLWKAVFFPGVADARCGRNAAAAAAFARAAEVPGATTEQAALAWYELGRARLAQGDAGGARTALEQAGERDPESRKIRSLLAQIGASEQAR